MLCLNYLMVHTLWNITASPNTAVLYVKWLKRDRDRKNRLERRETSQVDSKMLSYTAEASRRNQLKNEIFRRTSLGNFYANLCWGKCWQEKVCGIPFVRLEKSHHFILSELAQRYLVCERWNHHHPHLLCRSKQERQMLKEVADSNVHGEWW